MGLWRVPQWKLIRHTYSSTINRIAIEQSGSSFPRSYTQYIAARKKNEVWAPTNDNVSQLDEPGATKTQTSKLSAQTSRV